MLTDVIVVGQAPPHRSLGDLDVRGEDSVVEDRVAQPCSQRHDHFVPVARHHSAAGHFGVVENERGDAEAAADRRSHVEACPLLDQVGQDPRPGAVPGDVVGCCDNNAMADHSRHAHCRPVGAGQLFRQPRDGLDQLGRRQRVGGGGAHRARDDGALGVEHRGLDTASAAVDGERGDRGHGDDATVDRPDASGHGARHDPMAP